MVARLLSLLLGILLAGVGWAVVAPDGTLGQALPPLDLSLMEGHRAFIGWGAVVLGIAALLSAVFPRGGGGGGKRKTSPYADIDFSADAAPEAETVSHTPEPEGAIAVAEPEAPAEPVSPPPRMEAVAAPPGEADFQSAREKLRTLVNSEHWPEAAALARRLSASATDDRERMIAARDLGDFARSQGDVDQAAEAYQTAVLYARQTVIAAPGDATLKAELAASLTGVGDAAQDEGRLDDAVAAYEEVLEIRRELASTGGAPEQRALSLALERLADVREDRGHRVRALDLYRESFDIAGRLAAADPQAYGEDLAVTRRRLAELEARLAG